MAKLLSIGEMVIDFLPGAEEASYIRKAGGAPANVAIAAARQGCQADFCGMMGNDDFGHFLYKTLLDNGVNPIVKELTDKAITTMAFVSLDEQGDRSFTFARKPGADMFLHKSHVTDEALNSATVVHAGSCSLSAGDAAEATVYALSEGHARGKLVSFDVNYRNLMWHDDQAACAAAVMDILPYVDLLKISDEEADMLGGEDNIPTLMAQKNIALVIETLGSKGARAYWNDAVIEVPSLKANCVDPCGAGDAFWGGFLTALMKADVTDPSQLTEALLRNAIEHGNIAGWLCVQQKGAIESLPNAQDVEHYWEINYHG